MSLVPDLTGCVTLEEGTRFSEFGGAYGDTWKGNWQQGAETVLVAVRVLRTRPDKEDSAEKYRREIDVWKELRHDNICPLLGAVTQFGPYSSDGMISPWMENGDLNGFLEKKQSALQLTERFQILSDVISGIVYLHSKNIIHGDLTGTNILIDGFRRAYLIGFSLASVNTEYEVGGAIRWRAPELLPPLHGNLYEFSPNLTLACDIYSFGSVMFQVLSGKVPYHDIRSDVGVLVAVAQGICPHRPEDEIFTDVYWDFINRCWEKALDKRPGAEEVCRGVLELREAIL